MIPFIPEATLGAITLVVLLILYKWQANKDNRFDLTDALLGDDGRVSLFKIGQATALVVSTWAFAVLVHQGKLTEFYFSVYMTVWTGINLAKNLLGKAPDGSTGKA